MVKWDHKRFQGIELIDYVELTADGSITFDNIPSGYNLLIVQGYLKNSNSSGGNKDLTIDINDYGAGYYYTYFYDSGAVWTRVTAGPVASVKAPYQMPQNTDQGAYVVAYISSVATEKPRFAFAGGGASPMAARGSAPTQGKVTKIVLNGDGVDLREESHCYLYGVK